MSASRRLGAGVWRLELAAGDGEDAQALRRPAARGLEQPPDRPPRARPATSGAPFVNARRRSAGRVDARHPLAVGGERQLGDAARAAMEFLLAAAPRSIAASTRAVSIGSPTRCSAAHSRTAMRAPPPRAARARRLPSAGRSAATRIWFSVSVPVLSVQITVVSPSVSIAASRRTIAPRRAIARAPSASAAVTVAASPSGTAATATATRRQERSCPGAAAEQHHAAERRR